MKSAGAPIHFHTVKSALKALLVSKEKINILVTKNFKISDSWISNWLKKIGYSYRHVTNGKSVKQQLIIEYESKKFIDRIAIAVAEHHIPPELLINFDQTGLHLAPVSSTTFCEKGSKQVVVKFAKDKRQVTALLAGSASGKLLPIQIIFQGIIY